MIWTEEDNPIERVFDEAEKSARGLRFIVTHQDHPCRSHTEPGPELWEDEDGTDHPVTDAMREQWKQEGAFAVRTVYVGTCHSNGCDPATHGGLRA